MFLLNLQEQAAIERRRREEKERLTRIFNVKYRTIGIDKLTLDEQIKERELGKQLEKQRNDAIDRQMIRNDFKEILREENALRQQRKNAEELNEYRRLYQRAENTREWDLNDRNQWKSLPPTRVTDRLGLSSAQIFHGEDLQASDRKKSQQKQLRNDFDQQIQAKAQKDKQERLANLVDEYKQWQLMERGSIFEQMEEECHRAMNMAMRNYNEILANEVKIRNNDRKTRETEERLAELAHTAFSDLLTENSQYLSDSPCHILADRWKGMTEDQLADIRQQQLIQINEHQKNVHQNKYVDEIWGAYENARAKQESIIEQQIHDNHRHISRELAKENQNLAKIQRDQQEYLHSILYRSAPTAAFYQQFNTTSR